MDLIKFLIESHLKIIWHNLVMTKIDTLQNFLLRICVKNHLKAQETVNLVDEILIFMWAKSEYRE